MALLCGRLGNRALREVLPWAPDPVRGPLGGKPLVLEPWQRRMMGAALAFDSDGWPIRRSVVIVAPGRREDGDSRGALPEPPAHIGRSPRDPARRSLRGILPARGSRARAQGVPGITEASAYRAMTRARRNAKVPPHYHPHDLRHRRSPSGISWGPARELAEGWARPAIDVAGRLFARHAT
jgi:hypothetical protein